METLSHALLFIHLFGFSAVAGGLFSQYKRDEIRATKLAINGARVQLITGLLLTFIEPDGFTHLGVGLKLIGALIILIVLEMHAKKPLSQKLYYLLVAVLMLQVLIAVFFLEAQK